MKKTKSINRRVLLDLRRIQIDANMAIKDDGVDLGSLPYGVYEYIRLANLAMSVLEDLDGVVFKETKETT